MSWPWAVLVGLAGVITGGLTVGVVASGKCAVCHGSGAVITTTATGVLTPRFCECASIPAAPTDYAASTRRLLDEEPRSKP